MYILRRIAKVDPTPVPFTVPTWADGSDADIVTAINKHYAGEIDLTKFWRVGNERIVHLSAMDVMSPLEDSYAAQYVTLVLTAVGGKELTTPINGHTHCVFQVDQKKVLKDATGYVDFPDSQRQEGWSTSDRRTWCNSVYKNAMPATLRGIFKEFKNNSGYRDSSTDTNTIVSTDDYFALRAEIEMYGTDFTGQTFPEPLSIDGEGTWLPYYQNETNRYKYYDLSEGEVPSGGTRRDIALRSVANTGQFPPYVVSTEYMLNVGEYDMEHDSNSWGYFAPFGVI